MSGSLRLRLFLIIILPLMALAPVIGAWRITAAHRTAEELFDRTLLFTALAVSRDVALLDGDAVLPETQHLLDDAAGGPIRYHVYGPDGALVTGYAVPPLPLTRRMPKDTPFAYYDGLYKGDPVRVLRLNDVTTIAGLTGNFTVTVWQYHTVRNAFAWQLALRSIAVIVGMIAAVALLIWFGVRFGLKPLTDLEDAISRRSSEDLSPIQRRVPIETRGIVARLNTLFGKVSETLEAQAAFISDAAHQLRNPIAGLRALGESIRSAPDIETARARADDLVAAAAQAGRLANMLLTLERVRAESGQDKYTTLDLVELVSETVAEFRDRAAAAGVALSFRAARSGIAIRGDAVMLRETVKNLLDNALVHGGPGLSRVEVALSSGRGRAVLAFHDDGRGVAVSAFPKILSRFGQAQPGPGSGLGLTIAEAVARRHGGSLRVKKPERGFSVEMTLPMPSPGRTDG
ncbi:sensor histidine kinase N-terminal domain-containing protein [Actibacterium sp. MT2.3-13A]|uniref:sensor histidine kinase n=1 Tax=Actibacterium sp. MT2.3-13A TaxID=2828332 RepID=UPI001BA54604|nr:sensor histidine kinase N-terminal domain-containing protein [Actibacterium sp. MT2.3-13A]